MHLVSVPLQSGDILIMITDGIYDTSGHAVKKEMWMKQKNHEVDTDNQQDFAECLLERTFRHHHGEIQDDMTVVVARVNHLERSKS